MVTKTQYVVRVDDKRGDPIDWSRSPEEALAREHLVTTRTLYPHKRVFLVKVETSEETLDDM